MDIYYIKETMQLQELLRKTPEKEKRMFHVKHRKTRSTDASVLREGLDQKQTGLRGEGERCAAINNRNLLARQQISEKICL